MVPGTVRLSPPLLIDPVLKMSNSTMGAVDVPAELCPASPATARFPDGTLYPLPVASSAAEGTLV